MFYRLNLLITRCIYLCCIAENINVNENIFVEKLYSNYLYFLKSATSLTKCYRLKRNVLLIRNPPIQSARPFQCAYHPLTP